MTAGYRKAPDHPGKGDFGGGEEKNGEIRKKKNGEKRRK